MKKLFALLLALCLLLCACSKKDPDPTEAPTQSTTAPTTAPATQPSTEPTEAPAVGYVNPLTGIPEAESSKRLYAAVINNDKKALPHWGTEQADMLWEFPHEGNITRMMAVYTEVGDVPKIGPNRSARPYHLNFAQSLNAIFVHAGGSTQGYKDLASTGWNNLDGVKGKGADAYYHRDQVRLTAGVALEHTMYTTGPEVEAYAEKLGYKTLLDEAPTYGLTFAEDGTPNGESAETVNIAFRNNGKETNLHYDAERGEYTMEQYGMVYVDGNSSTVVGFENILILETTVGILNDYGALTVDLLSGGEGYFACGGKLVPITWSRESTESFFTFSLTDGTPLTLGAGTTYVAVVYNDAPISYS